MRKEILIWVFLGFLIFTTGYGFGRYNASSRCLKALQEIELALQFVGELEIR